jgi:hypothetical protein
MATKPIGRTADGLQYSNSDLPSGQLHIGELTRRRRNDIYGRANALSPASGSTSRSFGIPRYRASDGMRFTKCWRSETSHRQEMLGPAKTQCDTATCHVGAAPRLPRPQGIRRAEFPHPPTVRTGGIDSGSKTEKFSLGVMRKHPSAERHTTAEFMPSSPRTDASVRRHREVHPR